MSFGSLEKAIINLHGCKSKWVESVLVKEVFDGNIVWEGVVEVFDLEGHPTAKRAYVWSHSIDDSPNRKFFAVLHQGPVKSAHDSVRAAIVSKFKDKKGK